MEENKEKVVDNFTVNIKAVLDDEALNEISERIYQYIIKRLNESKRSL
jgi:flagellin-specific chaperone FliS